MVANKDELLHNIYHEVTQLKTVMLGIEGTDDKGMAGTVKDIEKHLGDLNGAVKSNTSFRKFALPLLVIIVATLIGVGSWISLAVGG